jgi:hypothetical protein
MRYAILVRTPSLVSVAVKTYPRYERGEASLWDLSGTDKQCASYGPGHLIHCLVDQRRPDLALLIGLGHEFLVSKGGSGGGHRRRGSATAGAWWEPHIPLRPSLPGRSDEEEMRSTRAQHSKA